MACWIECDCNMKGKMGNELPRWAGARSQSTFQRVTGNQLLGLSVYDGWEWGTVNIGASLTFLGL